MKKIRLKLAKWIAPTVLDNTERKEIADILDLTISELKYFKRMYASLLTQAREIERISDERQARIDQLMLEYCPGEMTPKQIATWEQNQTRKPNDTPSQTLRS